MDTIPSWAADATDTAVPDWAATKADDAESELHASVPPAWADEPKTDLSKVQLSDYDRYSLAVARGATPEDYSQGVPLPQNPDFDFTRATHGDAMLAVPLAIGAKIAGNKDPEAFPFKPLLNLPKYSDEDLAGLPAASQKLAGAWNALSSDVSGLTAPETLTQIFTGGSTKAVQLAFLGQMAAHFPDLAENVSKAKTPAEKAAAWTHLIDTSVMAGLLAKGFKESKVQGPTPKVEGPMATGEVLQMPEGARPPEEVQGPTAQVQSPEPAVESPESTVPSPQPEVAKPVEQEPTEGAETEEPSVAPGEAPRPTTLDTSTIADHGLTEDRIARTDRVEAGVPIQTFERPPDILDDIETHAGGVRIPDTADFDYVRAGFKELSQSKAADLGGFKLKKLFQGTAPDEALKALHEEGLWRKVTTPDELFQKMLGAAEARVEWMKQEKAAAKFKPESTVHSPQSTVETPDWAVAEVGPMDYVGMGGAVPKEFEINKGLPTAIKNAAVDAERVKRGLPPAMEPARRSFGDVWDQANAILDRAPDAPEQLMNELREQPRALTDTEDALLLQQQIYLQNEYGKVTRELAQAYDDAQQFPNRLDAVADLKGRAAKLSDDLLDLYNINKRVGTETGRGLAARRMMAYEDYSLAKMEIDKRAAKGGLQLSDGERAEVQRLHDQIAATQKAYDEYVAKTEAERAERQAKEEINDIVNRVAKTPGYDRNVLSLADRIVGALEKEADKARARLKDRFQRLNSGVDPTIVADLAVVGAAKIARGALDITRWSKEMIDEFGEEVAPFLNSVWKRANEKLDESVNRVAKGKTAIAVRRAVRKEDVTGQRESIIEGLRSLRTATKGKIPFQDLGPYARKLAENFIRSGIKDRDALIDAVHGVLTKEVDPNLSRRQAMDAISGYGDFKPLNQDAIAKELRDLKGQMQQVAKLEDIQGKQPLQKTGVERRVPSDVERRLIQQVNEAKRRFGVVNTDPATQLKSALDAIKTRLRNQIKDLDFQISTKEKIVRGKSAVPFDAEATVLKMERDKRKLQYDEIFTKPGLTDAQRVQNALRTVKASIEEYERRLATKDIAKLESKTPNTPELQQVRTRRDALRAEYQAMVDALDPQRRERAALASLKTRLANRTAELQDRLARSDFATRPRKTISLDPEAERLKADMERAKQAFQRGLLEDRLKQRPWYVKTQDTFLRWRRGFLLSSPVTLAKLTSAAVQRLMIAPIEEGIGAGISKVLPGLADRAPREGGLNVNAEAKALTEGWLQGMKDSWHQLRTGESSLDVIYGRGREGAIGESDVQPRSVIDFFGHLHGALKAPVKRAEFTRSFEKRSAWNLRHGIDVRDPGVQMRTAVEAYKDANRSIFLQDNRVVSAYKAALARLEQPPKGSKTAPIGGKLAATTARALLPIVRVPTNLVAETFQYALGTVSGSARFALAMRKGLENLSPDQADLIMRHLKKGSIGGALLLAGYLMPNAIGGYYQAGQKRDKNDVPIGGIHIGGMTVPSYLLHNPLLETLQLGATIRRVADSKLRKSDPNPQGLPAGLAAGALGLTEAVPFAREMLETSKAFDPHSRGAFVGELGKSLAVPQVIQWAAQQTDKDAQGNVVARKPQNALQHIETGIPVLRHNVPTAKLPTNPMVSRLMQQMRGGTPEMRDSIRQALTKAVGTNAPALPPRK
jgi:hypothetical protein